MELKDYVLPGITSAVVIGLVIVAYVVLKNSSLGQLLAAIFGDANAALAAAADAIKSCMDNGLTHCALGPFIIGAVVIALLFGILKGLGVLDAVKSAGAKKMEAILGDKAGEVMSTDAVKQTLVESEVEVAKDPTVEEKYAETLAIVKSLSKIAAKTIKIAQSSNPEVNKEVTDHYDKVKYDVVEGQFDVEDWNRDNPGDPVQDPDAHVGYY